MQTETKSRPTACLPLDHADSTGICDGKETSESDLHIWRAAQEKREAAAQHLQHQACSATGDTRKLAVTRPCDLSPLLHSSSPWGPGGGSHRIRIAFFSRQGKALFCPVWTGGKGRDSSPQLAPAHGAPGWLLFQGLSNGNTRSPASNQVSLLSPASSLVFPAKTSPWQGLAVASLPTLEET